MVNADCYGLSHPWILYEDLVGMLILFTEISKFHYENPQFLRHPIKFAIVDPSTAPDCTTKLTIKATERIFVGARSNHAFELHNDKKKYFLLTKKYPYLVTFKSIYIMYMLNWKQQMMISCSACWSNYCPDNCVHATVPKTFRNFLVIIF